jgi:hypothetical protein
MAAIVTLVFFEILQAATTAPPIVAFPLFRKVMVVDRYPPVATRDEMRPHFHSLPSAGSILYYLWTG